MTTHKQIEQQLKRPDSFQDSILKSIDFVKANKQKVALMIAPILAVALVGYGVFAWQQSQAAQRRAELAKLFTMQNDEATSIDKQKETIQKEIDLLRNPTAPAPKTADGKAAPAETKPELTAETLLKIGELEAKLATAKPDHAASAAAFKSFYDAHKSYAEGWMAGLSWAGHQLSLGKAAEVRPVLEDIVKSSTAHTFYQIQSRFMLTGVLEELGEFDAALKEAEILTGLVGDEAKPMVLLMKGQLLYFKDDKPAARVILSEIVEKHGSTREAQTARSLLAEIGPA